MDMDSSDSDNEDIVVRRRVRRKSKPLPSIAANSETPFPMLKDRRSLIVHSTSIENEQDTRMKGLVEVLKVTPSTSAKLTSSDLATLQQPFVDSPKTPYSVISRYLKKTIRKEHAGILINEVDGLNSRNEASTSDRSALWISNMSQYIRTLPQEIGRYHHELNLPRQIFNASADASIRTTENVAGMDSALVMTTINLTKWWTVFDMTYDRKVQLFRMRVDARNKLRHEPRILDEESIWGLKPLRYYFTAPYLKTSDGRSAAPSHPNIVVWRSQLEHLPPDFYIRQNWMAKDLAALKDCIREVLIERKLFRIGQRAEQLLKDCVLAKQQKDNKQEKKSLLGGGDDKDWVLPSAKRKGRPRKYGNQKVFASVTPTLCTLPNGAAVRYCVNNAEILTWRDKAQEAVRKLKYPALVEEVRDKIHEISWEGVANRLNIKTRKNRSPIDCYLAFKHEVDPAINCKRWSQQETKKLQGLVEKMEIHEIEQIAAAIGNNRTEFQCFQKWKNTFVKSSIMMWGAEKDDQLVELIVTHGANWKHLAFLLDDELATKNRVMDRFKKNSNPILKSGQFSRVEDALLILTIEKLKAHIAREGHFGELIAYLPWRFETVWRDRAGNLFANFIVPWTIEEDRQLLELANQLKKDWRKISNTFKSFKNRKGCLTRWKILQKRITEYGTLEAYHESYSITRYNVFQYRHLTDILELLKKAESLPQIPQIKISGAEPPNDEMLGKLLLSWNRSVLRSAIASLEKYIDQRNDTWKDVLEKVNDRQKTFDRRTFHRESAQSMASAVHIRGLHLLPRNEINFALNEYQEDVYKYYARFTRTKPLKRDAVRRYIPTAYELSQMSEVKDILQPREFTEEEMRKTTTPAAPTRASKRLSRKRKRQVESDEDEEEEEEYDPDEEFPEPELVDLVDDDD